MPTLLLVKERVPNLRMNNWFLDDGFLAGNRAEIIAALEIIITEGSSRGLRLSTSFTDQNPKTTVWARTELGDDPLGLGVPQVKDAGFVHLGCPIGSEAYIEDIVSARVDKLEEVVAKLPSLKDAHSEFVVLRSCLSIPKVTYLLRTTIPEEPKLRVWG